MNIAILLMLRENISSLVLSIKRKMIITKISSIYMQEETFHLFFMNLPIFKN
ncbi:hypothetical protein DAQ1742_01860 [Dickeya aquatica]|uniref:Uncharacterized protein n=1 Tax=Dickeya aquatica TaxID=1401087 RepID=A0A375A9Y9_9GAMM|nr:hypothetical protein DAQ1742_01860 [Dickeya aquatica]